MPLQTTITSMQDRYFDCALEKVKQNCFKGKMQLPQCTVKNSSLWFCFDLLNRAHKYKVDSKYKSQIKY